REELYRVLDEELNRLPATYRTPLVLCYLEGKTNEEAARELGWAAGSMSRHLTRARELLRERLSWRGVSISSGVLAGILAEQTLTAAVPPGLASTTVQAALLFAAGNAALAGAVSTKVLTLTQGV